MSPRPAPKRRNLFDANRIECDGPGRRVRTRPAIGLAVAGRNGAGLLQEIRADDRIGRTPIDVGPKPLALDQVDAIAQDRRVAYKRAVIDVHRDVAPLDNLRPDPRDRRQDEKG